MNTREMKDLEETGTDLQCELKSEVQVMRQHFEKLESVCYYLWQSMKFMFFAAGTGFTYV